MSETETLDARQTGIIDSVEKYGLSVMHVTAERPDLPSFSFSIGFEHTLGQPEVLIYGLERDLARNMINEVFRQCQEQGLVLADGQVISDVIEGYDCIARSIEDPRGRMMHFGYANWFQRRNGGENLRRAMQIVWPDPESKAFPWEDGFSREIGRSQVQLYPSGGPR
tara:strand:- start:1509 stop:2009 length:501 start_codon:yes stop_codon:yes gene_type:complete